MDIFTPLSLSPTHAVPISEKKITWHGTSHVLSLYIFWNSKFCMGKYSPCATKLPRECSFPDHQFPLTYFHICFGIEWALGRRSCDFSEKSAAIIIFSQVVLPGYDKMKIWGQSDGCNDIPVKKLQVFQGQLHLSIYTICKGNPRQKYAPLMGVQLSNKIYFCLLLPNLW